MKSKIYTLKYLPLFKEDLESTILYIKNTLENPHAAEKLLDSVEKAITKRAENPTSFKAYTSSKDRKYPYYKIAVGNYAIYYVVYDNVMELRRFIYNRRNVSRII